MNENVEGTTTSHRDTLVKAVQALTPESFTLNEFTKLLDQVQVMGGDDQLVNQLIQVSRQYFDLLESQRLCKEAERVRLARDAYLAFYDGSTFEGTYLPKEASVFPGLLLLRMKYESKLLTLDEFLKEVSQLSATEVHEKYWTIHSTEYKQRIDTLAEQVKAEKKEKIEQCKVLVVMAAMNETELELAYGALRDNYTSPEAFDAQVVLVIYHNHRENPGLIDPQVVQSVSLVTQFSNVVCIDEQVGTAAGINSDVAKAKKVAADVSLRLVGAQKKQILFIDGDLRKISPRGTLEQMQSRLSVEDGDVALSTVYCHDSRIDAHFPALAEYFRLVESISKQAQASSNDPVFTLGGFTMIDSTMFMAAGGWPISKPEDIHFTYRLLHIFCRLHVVRSLFPYVRVEMDVGREVQSILERKSAHHRWLGENHDEYMFISGSRRLALDSIPSGAIADVPLLHEQDAQRAVLVAINTNYLEFVKEMQNKKPDDQEIFQKRLKSRATQIFNFLKDMGISQVTIDAYHINPNSPTKESAQLNLDLNDPQIVDVFFQKYILTSFVALQSSQLKS